MAEGSQVDRLLRGADEWNQWRLDHPRVQPDLSEARLVNADLSRAVLDGADLRRADLSKAQLSHASLQGANLESATLILADLLGAVMNGCELSGASLFGAFLFGTRLKSANLKGANLLGACMMGADLSSADLSGAHLMGANFHEANLSGALFTKADLTAASLVATRVQDAVFESCLVHGISAWNLDGRPASQKRMIVTAKTEFPLAVQGLEAAQLISLLLYGGHVSTFLGRQVVLVLGRFRGRPGEIDRLVSDELYSQGYLAITADLGKPASADDLKFVLSAGRWARFVLLDQSSLRNTVRVVELCAEHCPEVPILLIADSSVDISRQILPQSNNLSGPQTYSSHQELLRILRSAVSQLGATGDRQTREGLKP